jgi:hypothetical protein
MNNKEKFFEPILKIYNIFLQSKEIEYDKFISYENALNNISLFELMKIQNNILVINYYGILIYV